MYFGFPKEILAVVMTYFGFARRLVVMGSASEALQTYTAIVAGSKFSVCILKMV
jgi:hypothetical protein